MSIFGVQIFDAAGRKTFDSDNSGLTIRGRFTISTAQHSGSFKPALEAGMLFCIPSAITTTFNGSPQVWVEGTSIRWDFRGWSAAERQSVQVRYGWA